MADLIELEPLGPLAAVSAHERVRVTSSGLHELVLGAICERSGGACPPASLEVAASGQGEIVLYWAEACGYRLQASTSIEVPGLWEDLSNSSPVQLPADQPYRYYRLICDN